MISADFGRMSPTIAFYGANYAIQVTGGGPIKIGFTCGHAKGRLRALQAASPYMLEVVAFWPATKAHEKAIHSELSDYRVRSEWYHPVVPVWDRVLAEFEASRARDPNRLRYIGLNPDQYCFEANSFLHERISRHDLRPDLSRIFIGSPPAPETEAA